MKKINFLLLIMSISSITFAQTDTTKNFKNFLFYFGLQSLDITNLNTILSMNKYPQLNKNNRSIGADWIEFTNRFVWSSNIYYYSQYKSNDTMTSSISTWGVGQSYGYTYIKKPKLNIYSVLGWNYSVSTVKVTKDIASNTSFSTYTSSFGNQIEMNTGIVLLKIETNINYILKFFKKSNNLRFIIGVRGGYLFPISKTKWNMNGKSLEDGPNTNPGGYYAMLNIGYRLK